MTQVDIVLTIPNIDNACLKVSEKILPTQMASLELVEVQRKSKNTVLYRYVFLIEE